MSWVGPYGASEAWHRPVQLLCKNILVAQQGIGVGERGIHLNSSLEEFDGRVMLFL